MATPGSWGAGVGVISAPAFGSILSSGLGVEWGVFIVDTGVGVTVGVLVDFCNAVMANIAVAAINNADEASVMII